MRVVSFKNGQLKKTSQSMDALPQRFEAGTERERERASLSLDGCLVTQKSGRPGSPVSYAVAWGAEEASRQRRLRGRRAERSTDRTLVLGRPWSVPTFLCLVWSPDFSYDENPGVVQCSVLLFTTRT